MKFNAKIIRVYNDKKSPVKASATLTVEGGDYKMVIRDIRLVDTGEKQFVAFSNRNRNGQYVDVCHPCNPATRKKVQDAVLCAYHAYASAKERGIA